MTRGRPDIRIKRAYEPPAADDGARVLVDRLWPRGLRKDEAALDLWLKEAGPSTELRKWFGHDPARFDEFERRYLAEIDAAPAPLERLAAFARRGPLTLLFAAHDERHNNAVVLARRLADYMEST
ncbi:MAG: DUF488 domain-containing protein [Caulobacteraceae bacterium]